MRFRVNKKCRDEVRQQWGNQVAAANVVHTELLCELFEKYDMYRDYDRDADSALEIGVLAGEMKSATPDEFIKVFETKLLPQIFKANALPQF